MRSGRTSRSPAAAKVKRRKQRDLFTNARVMTSDARSAILYSSASCRLFTADQIALFIYFQSCFSLETISGDTFCDGTCLKVTRKKNLKRIKLFKFFKIIFASNLNESSKKWNGPFENWLNGRFNVADAKKRKSRNFCFVESQCGHRFRWRNASTDKRRKRIELPVLTIQGEKWKMKKTCDLWLLLTRFTRGKILGAKI